MIAAEQILFWIMLFGYVVSFCLHMLAWRRRSRWTAIAARASLWLGFGLHTAVVITRWIGGGHPPVTDTYELNLCGTWIAVLLFALCEAAFRLPRAFALVVIPVVFLALGHARVLRTDPEPMTDAYDSAWLVVHVVFAWLAFGSFLISAAAASMLLWKRRVSIRQGRELTVELERLDQTSYRFVVVGFVNHAVMLISGAIWAMNLWGRYWSWDALETWSLLTFLFYAFYLHARAFLGLKMQKAAWLAAFGLIVLSISFWGVNLFGPSDHPGP